MQESKKHRLIFPGSGLRMAIGAGLLLSGMSCYRQEHVSREIRVPGLQCAQCSNIVFGALSAAPKEELLHYEVDPVRHLVRVTFDSTQTEIRNLEHVIAETGFQADDIPAYPDAVEKLPEPCRSHPIP